jgi:hypothetical protein
VIAGPGGVEMGGSEQSPLCGPCAEPAKAREFELREIGSVVVIGRDHECARVRQTVAASPDRYRPEWVLVDHEQPFDGGADVKDAEAVTASGGPRAAREASPVRDVQCHR